MMRHPRRAFYWFGGPTNLLCAFSAALSTYFNPDSSIEPTNRGDFHSGELLCCRRIFLFMNHKFYSLQKCVLRLAFHPL